MFLYVFSGNTDGNDSTSYPFPEMEDNSVRNQVPLFHAAEINERLTD